MHPELVAVLLAAAVRWNDYLRRTDGIDARVRFTSGLRSRSDQVQHVKSGASRTMESKHLKGKAVDVALFLEGELTWDMHVYTDFASIVDQTARDLEVAVAWGGDFPKLRDGPHFELSEPTPPF